MPQSQIAWARLYLATQAVAAVIWWISVFAVPQMKESTLGGWNATALAIPDLVLFAAASAVVGWRPVRGVIVALVTWTIAVTLALSVYALLEQRAGWGAFVMVLALAGTAASALTCWHGHLPVRWFFLGPFRFKEAAEKRQRNHLRDSIGQLVLFWTFFLLFVPFALSKAEHRVGIDSNGLDEPVVGFAGISLFLTASGLGLWSCFTMAIQGKGTPLPAATARELVIAGPYRFVRNPMAVAGVAQTIGVGLAFGSWTAGISALAGALIWNTAIRPSEEADLASRFGSDYERYSDEVGCWLPTSRYKHKSDE